MTTPDDTGLGPDQQVPAEDPAEGSTSPSNQMAGQKSQAEGDDDETAE